MDNDLNIKIGKRIKNRREELKMTQLQLAVKLGMKDRSTITRYEQGGKTFKQSQIVALSDALETTPAYLMGWLDENNEKTQAPIESEPKIPDTNSGILLTELMKEHNISTVELAKEIHISVTELEEYETGKKRIPFEVVKKLADYFNIDVTVLNQLEINRGENDLKTTLRLLEQTSKWNKEIGHVEFTDKELAQLINYAKFILSQRKDER